MTRRALRMFGALVASLVFTSSRGAAYTAPLVPKRSARDRIVIPARPTFAQEASGSPAQDQPVQRFDIAPGPLATVAAAFEKATGISVVAPADAARAVYSPGVAGLCTIEQALAHILEGTGFGHRFTSASEVVLEIAVPPESVTVTARPPATLGSAKYVEAIRDTPQSIDLVSRQLLDDQGSTTLRDAVRNVAGISLAAGEGGSQGDNLTVRGFSARNDLFIDGMRDFGSYYRDPFNTEQVQVLKGPTSVTYGRGSTGGVVNQASKTPERDGFLAGSLSFGTDATRRVTTDINQPLPRLGRGAAFRLNVMAHDAGVAGRDSAENRRLGIAPSLAFGLGTPTRAILSYFHQSADDTPDYGFPWLFDRPAPVSHSNYYGFEDANFLRTSADIATMRVEHDTNAFSIRNQIRYASYSRSAQISEARTTANVLPTTPLEQVVVNRNQIAVSSAETFLQDQFDVTTRLRTGAVRHALVAGVEAGRETSNPTRYAFTGVPTTSLLTPDPHEPFSGTSSVSSDVHASAVSFAGYVIDTAAVGDRWQVTGGARWDRFDAEYKQSVQPASAFTRVDEKPSWRAAVVYKPRESGSIYSAFSTSFNPSAETLSLSASTANTPPEDNRTYEVGSKWDLASGRLSVRGAAFRTEKVNAREPDPNNPLQYVLAGTQRVDGIEGDVTGRITNRWTLMSSYALLDSALIKSPFYPVAVGSRLANVPRHTFSVWSTCDLPWRFTIGAGGHYVGMRTASTTTPLDPTTGLLKEVPGYWAMSAMARRQLTPRLDLQVNVDNLANAHYFDQLHPAHIVPGPARSALVGMNFKF